MQPVFLDIEGDGLYPQVKTVFCIVTKEPNYETKVWSDQTHPQITMDGPVSEMVDTLRVVSDPIRYLAHNGFGYDFPLLRRDCSFTPRSIDQLWDTLTLCRIVYPGTSILQYDTTKYAKSLPRDLVGSHSLRAWGYRLGYHKGEHNDFSGLTPEMVEYCKDDVVLLELLYEHLTSEILRLDISEDVINLEMQTAEIIAQQMLNGAPFDEEAAIFLDQTLRCKQHTVYQQLQEVFEPTIETMKSPAYYLTPDDEQHPTIKAALAAGWKREDVIAGPLRTKEHPFNPSSRGQIVDRLIKKYKWEPQLYTDPSKKHPNGQPKANQDVLEHLDYPEAALLTEYLILDKRVSQLSGGDAALLNHVKPDGKIYGYVNTCGCRTYRMTHNSPNLAQVPGAAKPYGLEFRALFKAPPGKKIVGIDASNLEGLFKGHYLQPYDNGAFLDMVLNDGDLHSRNAEILDLTRAKAKTWYYAWVFGASAAKLATITGRTKAVEQKFKDKFLASWPELAALLAGLEAAWKERGYLIGLDGRRLENESAHTLLNTVCQSAGAILMKKALVEFNKRLTENYSTAKWEFILNVHDEWQLVVDEDIAEDVGQLGVSCIVWAGEGLNVLAPMSGEYKVGNTWAETH